MSRRKKIAVLLIVGLVVIGLLAAYWSLGSASEFDKRVGSITDRYEFNVWRWQASSILGEIKKSFSWPHRVRAGDVETVRKYFESPEQNRSLENKAERILNKQIKTVLAKEGILNPLDPYIPIKSVFPPLNFEFESPPSVLVISPRDEIRLVKRTTLKPDVSDAEREAIESQVDALDVSSLVVRVGGVGFTYPTMISTSRDIRSAIETAVHEWFHQYLAFRPLGFLYLLDSLDIRRDYTVITMNETLAGMVGKEIGDKVYQRYYAAGDEPARPPPASAFDFNQEMRRIRLRVDELLAQGNVTEAEKFMRERRDFLESNGYYIRKLNQAYFAFHGTYADDPTSVSPIGRDMQKLRAQSSSLRRFLSKVTGMTDYGDLRKAVEE